MERRLERQPDLKVQYHEFMEMHKELGQMELVKSQEPMQPCYFLPLHVVFKETSTTKRTIVVFDGSAKTYKGLSLNNILQVGPTVQPGLYCLVLGFRTHQVCFAAYITKMNRQITLHPIDRNLQKILWRYSTEEPIQEYQLNNVTHGAASGSYLAKRCPKKLAGDNKCHHLRLALVLSNEFYVNDILSGTPILK